MTEGGISREFSYCLQELCRYIYRWRCPRAPHKGKVSNQYDSFSSIHAQDSIEGIFVASVRHGILPNLSLWMWLLGYAGNFHPYSSQQGRFRTLLFGRKSHSASRLKYFEYAPSNWCHRAKWLCRQRSPEHKCFTYRRYGNI